MIFLFPRDILRLLNRIISESYFKDSNGLI